MPSSTQHSPKAYLITFLHFPDLVPSSIWFLVILYLVICNFVVERALFYKHQCATFLNQRGVFTLSRGECHGMGGGCFPPLERGVPLNTPLHAPSSCLWSDTMGARRRRAKALHRRAPPKYYFHPSALSVTSVLSMHPTGTTHIMWRNALGAVERENACFPRR